MAELPEIETLRRDLDKEVSGKRIKSVEVPGRKDVIPTHINKRDFTSKLEGAKVTGVNRRGMLLVLKLDNDHVLVIDLRKGGQIRRHASKDPMAKGTQVVMTFTQQGQLRFVDPSHQLRLEAIVPTDLATVHPELATQGSDPLDEPISWTKFGNLMLSRQLTLKALLMDPTVVVGIGPVYSDEILFGSGLRPDRQSEEMSTQEMRRLYRALVEVLHAAAKHRGATLADGVYTDLQGRAGDFRGELRVYERDGQQCYRCRKTVAKAKVGGKVTYWCPGCQV